MRPTSVQWTPTRSLAALGAAAGIVAGLLAFDRSCARFGPPAIEGVADTPILYVGLCLGMVVCYGVWRWGRGRWPALLLALGFTEIAWLAAVGLFGIGGFGFGVFDKRPEDIGPHAAFLWSSLAAAVCGPLFSLGTASAITASSPGFLRPADIPRYVLAGLSVLLLYAPVQVLQNRYSPACTGVCPCPVQWWELPLEYAAAAGWFAILGAAIGYGFARRGGSAVSPQPTA